VSRSEQIAAVLFDMDGTITDTEHYYLRAFDELAARDGVTLTDADREAMIGASFETMFEVAAAAGIGGGPQRLTPPLVEAVLAGIRSYVKWQPGALELLRALKTAGVPTGLVTMSYRALADEVVRQIPFPAFDVVVAGDEVERGKPDPQAYQVAAERLGVDIGDCIVIEDSATGVAAGLAAGATVVAVPFYTPLPESDAYTLWPEGLAPRGIADLAALAA
jgi:HAD superfamily hydrolase (TIGR01509 family)